MKYSLLSSLIISFSLLNPNDVIARTINNNQDIAMNGSSSEVSMLVGDDTDGKLTITTGGELTTGNLLMGYGGGDGEINIINGGKVIITSTNFANALIVGFRGTDTKGVLNISGAGSLLTADPTMGEFSVGNEGAEGYLNITDGGKLDINRLWIGARGGDTTKGFVNVQGEGSEIFVAERIIVGTWNYGVAIFSDGATLITNHSTTSAISIGNELNNQQDNLMVVTGENTTATATNGGVMVGYGGKGTLVVSDKAILSVGKDITIASDNTATGELAIGSRKGEQATGAGFINADSIRFGAGTGVLVFNHTNPDYTLGAAIHGNGAVEALSGVTILTGANDYTGNTLIDHGGILQAGTTNTFSSNSAYTVNAGGGLSLNGYNQIIPTLTSAGVTHLSGTTAGTALNVTGNYTGQEGYLLLGTQLGDDSSITDQLIIQGDATGTTHVTVNNLGGSGAQTIEGIKIIDVHGTSEDSAFVQNGRIVAGAYDYSLIKGSATGQDEQSWYLTSKYNPSGGGMNTIRPEALAYLGNLSLANNMFNLRLHDRQVERTYIDPVTGQKKTTTLWMRHQYGHNQFNDTTGSLHTKTNKNTLQLGGDIAQWSSNDNDRFHLGAMMGYGYAHGQSKSKLTKYSASSEVKGYSLGLYGTWYQHNTDKMGLYVDSWLLWNQFTAKVNGQELKQEKYHLKGVTSSLEMGYTFNVGQIRSGYQLWLQPQAQLTWQGIKADKHKEDNGTLVRANRDNIQTRVGARVMLVPEQSKSSDRFTVTPFLEGNWLHNSRNYSVSMNNEGITQAGTKNIAEIKAGVEGNITDNTTLWFNVGHQFSHDSYKDTTTTFGIKYSF